MKALVVSDVHGNADALTAVLEDAGPCDELWSLGDVVGYGAEPLECVELITAFDGVLHAVSGNHDLAALGRLPLADFIPAGREAIEWTIPRLGETELAWLDRPPSLAVESRTKLWHAGPIDPVWGYLSSIGMAAAAFETVWNAYGFFGHTHRPIIYFQWRDGGKTDRLVPRPGHRFSLNDFGRRVLLNPGSVGQPRDGDARAAYAIVDMDDGWIEWRRAEYPVEECREKILAAGLPAVLADRLAHGL